jgi:hypothetical protein
MARGYGSMKRRVFGAFARGAGSGGAARIAESRVRTLVFLCPPRQNRNQTMTFAAHQRVRVNLAGLMIQGVTFHAAVTDALATIVRKTTEEPPAYLVDLLFSFKGLKQIEVPGERIRPA